LFEELPSLFLVGSCCEALVVELLSEELFVEELPVPLLAGELFVEELHAEE